VNPKITGLLGMCRRAGHLTVGFDAVKDLVRQQKATLVLTAEDLSEKTKKELRFQIQDQVPYFPLPLRKDVLSAAIGMQKPVGVIATDDRGFAAALLKLKEDDAL
jgi:ribosomal protein L7Ae-like RNA K-turn-binding protein